MRLERYRVRGLGLLLAIAGCAQHPPGLESESMTEGAEGGTFSTDSESSSSSTAAGEEATGGPEASGGDESTGEDVPHVDPVYGQFLWPFDGWVSAIDFYFSGSPHSGSADLSAPHWTPVGAARGGVVTRVAWGARGGWIVRIDHGHGYTTGYSHFIEPPLVEEEDIVTANQLLGYVGRTGNAFMSGAHIHFTLSYEGERIILPEVDFRHWAQRGQPIPGNYDGLEVIELPQETFDVRVVVPDLPVYEEASMFGPIVGELNMDDVVTVYSTDRGFLRIQFGDDEGWIVHSGTEPALSNIIDLEVTASSASIYAAPEADAEIVGTVSEGALFAGFETVDGYHRVLYRDDDPSTYHIYRWIRAQDTQPTSKFRARIRGANSANVRSGPGIEHEVIGSLDWYQGFVVQEVQRGWYRLNYEDTQGWVSGRYCSGRL